MFESSSSTSTSTSKSQHNNNIDFSGVTLKEIVEGLKSCNYNCDAGPLEDNVLFRELKRRANAHMKNKPLHELKVEKGIVYIDGKVVKGVLDYEVKRENANKKAVLKLGMEAD